MGKNLFNKVWDIHKVDTLPNGQDQLLIGLHLIHEVTSPQAFSMLKERGLSVLFPQRTFGTADHIVPTLNQSRPFADSLAEEMMQTIETNTKNSGIRFFGLDSEHQGIVHIIGPELGLTRPGMTIACGDSHTSTHGAFGSIAFGIGTSQIRDILATGTMAISRPNVRKINITGEKKKGVYAKDFILKIIAELGVNGGLGYAYEYTGSAVRNLSMEERMTICNMSIEGGARAGYVNPDQTTFDYIKGKKYAPTGAEYDKALAYWKSVASDSDAQYDDAFDLNINSLEPMITWGINPGQGMGIGESIPDFENLSPGDKQVAQQALSFMGFEKGQKLLGQKINVVFIGSCTNGRISDLREAAKIVKGKKVADGVRALVVPGSKQVSFQAREEGLDKIFTEAGVSWQGAGCSMCLAMNPDKLIGRELCASSSNRNFIGRQGSVTGRTILMSPAMAAAAAVNGHLVDVRDYL